MGVPQIWELLKPYTIETRVPLRTYLSGTPRPKIAIDAYHIFFECGYFQIPELGKPTLNFMKRLKDLVSIDSSFLLVFDGLDKPKEKNASKNIPPFIYFVKDLCRLLGIEFMDSPGEGEVQCCWLQKQGIVDLVWSNDSDCLIFGADNILKNYSKSTKDIGVTSGEYNKTNNESFVTHVPFFELKKNKDVLDRQGLLFFSILLGADYNQGIKGLGKEKCFNLALLKSPNFSQEFCSLFESRDIHGDKSTVLYERFQKRVFAYCRDNSRQLFGRNYNNLLKSGRDNFEGWPDIDTVNHYFHPSCSKYCSQDIMHSDHTNISGSKGYDKIDFVELKRALESLNLPSISNFDYWFHETMLEMFLVKFILYDGMFANNSELYKNYFKITEEKTSRIDNSDKFIIEYWKIRYNTYINSLEEPILNAPHSRSVSPQCSPTRSPTKRQVDISQYKYGTWVPKSCIPDDHILVNDYNRRKQKKLVEDERLERLKILRSSPKKRFQSYSQKNDLTDFLAKHATPVSKTSSSMKKSLNTSELTSVKRRLFVREDEDELANSDKEDDDSLIILDEINVLRPTTSNVANSPKRRFSSSTDDSLEYRFESPALTTHVSPLKKQYSSHVETGVSTTPVTKLTPSANCPLVILDNAVPILSREDTFHFQKKHHKSHKDSIPPEVGKFIHIDTSTSDTNTTATSSE